MTEFEKNRLMKESYESYLEEMCEDIGISVQDADEVLKQMAREFVEEHVKDLL